MTAAELDVAIEELRMNPAVQKVPKNILADALLHGAAMEARRIERELWELYNSDCPAFAKLAAQPWISKVELILKGQTVRR